jgi:O-antigen/teichoic acid export membrane protein
MNCIQQVFLKLQPRTKGVIFVGLSNYFSRFGSVLVIIITIPMVRLYLDTELFGIWMMLSSFIAFLGFADLGLGYGAMNRLTIAYAKEDKDGMRHVFSSTFACMTCISLIIISSWGLWLLFSPKPEEIIGKFNQTYKENILYTFSIFFILFSVNLPLSLIQKAQLAAQKGYIASLWNFLASLITLLAIPIVIHLDLGLAAILICSLGATVLINAINMLIWLNIRTNSYNLRWRYITGFHTSEILKLGFQFFIIQLAVAFAYQSDVIVITQTLGVDAYGDYAIIQKIFITASLLVSTAIGGLWPAFGNAFAEGDITWIKKILLRSFIYAGIIILILVGLIEIYIKQILYFWLGYPLIPNKLLYLSFGIWSIIDVIGGISGSFMNGAGIIRPQVIVALFMAAFAFLGKWILVSSIGVSGVVISTIIAYILISVPWQISVYIKLFSRQVVTL